MWYSPFLCSQHAPRRKLRLSTFVEFRPARMCGPLFTLICVCALKSLVCRSLSFPVSVLSIFCHPGIYSVLAQVEVIIERGAATCKLSVTCSPPATRVLRAVVYMYYFDTLVYSFIVLPCFPNHTCHDLCRFFVGVGGRFREFSGSGAETVGLLRTMILSAAVNLRPIR